MGDLARRARTFSLVHLFLPSVFLLLAPTMGFSAYVWKPLRIGAGGWLTGLDIVSDGTKVVRTDTYGAYIWNASTTQWDQLVTAARLGQSTYLYRDTVTMGVYEVRIAESNHNRIYMVWDGYVYRSDDKGAHWTKTSFPRRTNLNPNDGNRTSGQKMAVDPANADVVYLGAGASGVWRSYDAGATWAQVTAIPAGSGPGHAGIVFDATSGTDGNGRTNTIYVPSYGNGVWSSTNAGSTWTRVAGGGLGGPTNVWHAQAATDGIYYCADGTAAWRYGAGTWTVLASANFQIVATDPVNPARIVVAGDGGFPMRESLDRGANWIGGDSWWGAYPAPGNPRVATDIPWLAWTDEAYMSAGDMRVDASDGKLYFAEGIGVWNTTFPTTFTAFNWTSQSKGIEQLVANWIWSVPGGALFVDSWDRPIFRSTNPEAFPSTHGPNNHFAYGASVEHAVNNSSFLALSAGWYVDESGYSTDGGATWAKFAAVPPWTSPGLGHLAVSTDQNMVWAANMNKPSYYTKDRGSTWLPLPSPVNVSTQSAQFHNRHIVTADRVTPNKFYLYVAAGVNAGLFVSSSSGDTWSRAYDGHIVNTADGFNAKLKSVPGKAGHLFYTNGPYGGGDHVGPDPGELFKRSTDGGATWATVPGVLEVYDFGFGKEAPGQSYPTIFIAGFVSNAWGIWRSDNEGQSWTQVGDFPLGSVDTIKAVEGDKNVYGTVYVGFQGSGYAYGTPAIPSDLVFRDGFDQSGLLAPGARVTLTAAAGAGSTSRGWSGGCTGSCQVKKEAAKRAGDGFPIDGDSTSVPGDFNGDGQPDLLWHNKLTGDLKAWFLDRGAVASESPLTPDRLGDTEWQIAGLADFNGDGRSDILWQHLGTGNLSVWFMNGTTLVSSVYLQPNLGGIAWQIRGLADFSEDSKADILWHHPESGTLYVSIMDGTAAVSGLYLTTGSSADTGWRIGGLADFNADGAIDILWRHNGTGDLYVWFMQGTKAIGATDLTPSRPTDPQWRIVRTADLDGDGQTDILWQNHVSGQLHVWFMNGTTVASVGYLEPPAFADLTWEVVPR